MLALLDFGRLCQYVANITVDKNIIGAPKNDF